jgi:hypothetical protein
MARSLSLLAAAAVAAGLSTGAAAQGVTQIGTLNCDVSGGLGLIVASQREMICTFVNVAGEREIYTGVIRRFGIDLGATVGGQIIWSVFAPSAVVRGALAGNYAGASAEATVGAGLGANVLVGGSNLTIALQPLSVGGQAGLNVALGVADLQLRAMR